VKALSVRGESWAKAAPISVQLAVLRRNFPRFHALTGGLSGGTNRQEKCMNNPNQPKPSQPQQGNPRPGQQQGGGGQKPGQQQQGGGQQKPGQQPGQGGHQGGQQGGMDR
jgi:type VI secretion system secreted protein VgrG